jgi:hypothetical protein
LLLIDLEAPCLDDGAPALVLGKLVLRERLAGHPRYLEAKVSIRIRISALRRGSIIAARRRSATSAGVPAGAHIANHPAASMSKPLSRSVGTSGRKREREAPSVARMRILPASWCSMNSAAELMNIGSLPVPRIAAYVLMGLAVSGWMGFLVLAGLLLAHEGSGGRRRPAYLAECSGLFVLALGGFQQ